MSEGHLTDRELECFARVHLAVQDASLAYIHLRDCPSCNGRYNKLIETVPLGSHSPVRIRLDSEVVG